jgi:hypothetical protein
MLSRLTLTTMSAMLVGTVTIGVRAARDTDRVQSLAWLAGCWEAAGPTRSVEEQWMRPRGGTMLGMSRTTQRADKTESTAEHEFLRVYARDGKLVYAAQPSGQASAEFTETELGATHVVFGNPTHDFPHVIRYRRIGADSLHARVEGTLGGSQRGFDFRYRRVACGVTPSS